MVTQRQIWREVHSRCDDRICMIWAWLRSSSWDFLFRPANEGVAVHFNAPHFGRAEIHFGTEDERTRDDSWRSVGGMSQKIQSASCAKLWRWKTLQQSVTCENAEVLLTNCPSCHTCSSYCTKYWWNTQSYSQDKPLQIIRNCPCQQLSIYFSLF